MNHIASHRHQQHHGEEDKSKRLRIKSHEGKSLDLNHYFSLGTKLYYDNSCQ